jgi:predicted enzyme related to lactoylglutathione lyase
MAQGELSKSVVEVGIIVNNATEMQAFYGDVLGLPYVGDLEFGGGMMRRYAHGDAVVKLVSLGQAPTQSNPPNGPAGGASGLRYFTLAVSDLDGLLARCTSAGHEIVVPAFEFAPGVRVAMVEDPDGNWVELVQST